MSERPEESIKIALIEPEASDVERIKELVKSGSIHAEIADAMSIETPHLESAQIILLGLQDLGPVEIEALTRLHAGYPKIPLIVLAGPALAPRAAEAVRLGAQHVLVKSELTTEKLSSTLRYFLGYASKEPTHTA
ncbi:MAG: response regulator [Elusimicrobiota bacterium]|nr:response regulator [Elusimicrobiota bacterium]